MRTCLLCRLKKKMPETPWVCSTIKFQGIFFIFGFSFQTCNVFFITWLFSGKKKPFVLSVLNMALTHQFESRFLIKSNQIAGNAIGTFVEAATFSWYCAYVQIFDKIPLANQQDKLRPSLESSKIFEIFFEHVKPETFSPMFASNDYGVNAQILTISDMNWHWLVRQRVAVLKAKWKENEKKGFCPISREKIYRQGAVNKTHDATSNLCDNEVLSCFAVLNVIMDEPIIFIKKKPKTEIQLIKCCCLIFRIWRTFKSENRFYFFLFDNR